MLEKPRVLVVEDDPTFHEIYRMYLEKYAEITIAISVEGALRALTENEFAYVILDGRVPRFDKEAHRTMDTTIALAYHIKEYFAHMQMFSASADEELNEELARIGCTHANKATAPQALIEILRAL